MQNTDATHAAEKTEATSVRSPREWRRMTRTVMAAIIDYAGLFPPAGLGMGAALEAFFAGRRSPGGFALRRFVVPVSRLDELERGLSEHRDDLERHGLPLSLVISNASNATVDAECAARAHEALPCRRPGVQVSACEVAPLPADAIAAVARRLPIDVPAFFEVPAGTNDAAPRLAAIGRCGRAAKVRTGGVRPDDFPTPEALADFIVGCSRFGLPFKATAGLHHPIRSRRALGSGSVIMHGFVNLVLGAALVHTRLAGSSEVAALLSRTEGFELGDESLTCGGHVLTAEEIGRTRRSFFTAFGSCSFAEPVAEIGEIEAR